jgi:O-antigen ligase
VYLTETSPPSALIAEKPQSEPDVRSSDAESFNGRVHVPAVAQEQSFRAPAIVFVAFLLLVFVGLRPFAVRDEESLLAGAAGDGDLVRQIAFVAVFLAASLVALLQPRGRITEVVPAPLAAVLCWCLLSVVWAIEPVIALRRVGLTILVVCTIAACINSIGGAGVLRLLRGVLALVLIANLVSIAVIPQAVHLDGERAADLVGAWRGMHFHKNAAGVIAALSAMVFLAFALETRRWANWALFGGAVVFLVMTRAKTSIALLGIAVAAGLVYRHALRDQSRRPVTLFAMVTGLCVVFILALLNHSALAALLQDPDFLTGRGAIWQALIASVQERPILGVGYGSFWNIGASSPVTQYVDNWVMSAAHGHNGYLDLLVQTGVIGLGLVLLALIVIPLARLMSAGPGSIGLKTLCFSVLVFVVFFNVTESGLVERDRPEWVLFVMMLMLFHARTRSEAVTSTEGVRRRPGIN